VLLAVTNMKALMILWPLAISIYLFWSFIAAVLGAN
jgi:hypothetical protein